jgi:hypothetical protein
MGRETAGFAPRGARSSERNEPALPYSKIGRAHPAPELKKIEVFLVAVLRLVR